MTPVEPEALRPPPASDVSPGAHHAAPLGDVHQARVDGLTGRLGLAGRLVPLIRQAVAHRSWCAETPGWSSNERLEFLGDSVLGLVVTDYLYLTYPALPEGELAKVRASVVNAAALAEVAASLDLGAALLLGKGEDASGGREKPSILADAMEAVIGAVYLDLGWRVAEQLVLGLVGPMIEAAAVGPGGGDYKTRLQELCAQEFDQLPVYDLDEDGPDHAKRFDAVVVVGGRRRGAGRGRSKKQAEQAAARDAWEEIFAEAGGAPSDGDRGSGSGVAAVES